MKFIVNGADRETGGSLQLLIEATDGEKASAAANAARMLVSSYRPDLSGAPSPGTPIAPAVQANGPPIICPNPNCGYCGISVAKRRLSFLVLALLLLFFIIPGIFFAIYRSGFEIICPRCGMWIRTDY
jgi:hypothetical protein